MGYFGLWFQWSEAVTCRAKQNTPVAASKLRSHFKWLMAFHACRESSLPVSHFTMNTATLFHCAETVISGCVSVLFGISDFSLKDFFLSLYTVSSFRMGGAEIAQVYLER